jgi:CheY-like chemotaxis protein
MTKRILVVEDQEDNRRIIRDLHAERGYRTVYVGPEHLATPPFRAPRHRGTQVAIHSVSCC